MAQVKEYDEGLEKFRKEYEETENAENELNNKDTLRIYLETNKKLRTCLTGRTKAQEMGEKKILIYEMLFVSYENITEKLKKN